MLNVDGNENGKKKTTNNNKQKQKPVGVTWQKKKKKHLCICSTLFGTLPRRCCCNVKLPSYTFFGENVVCARKKILLLGFLLAFFHCPSFLPYCPLAVLISFRRYIMLFFQRNSSSLLSFKISLLALCRSSVLVELP